MQLSIKAASEMYKFNLDINLHLQTGHLLPTASSFAGPYHIRLKKSRMVEVV